MAERDVLQDLGDGLILRRATGADRERVAEFHANTLLDAGEEAPLERMYFWVLDLMGGAVPGVGPGDFTIVEDTARGNIVSSMALLSQTWTYEGIPFPFGQPDIVSTDPAYRRRGLVRAQMETIHRWSAERGELVQGITGIPWYYRQFGYEMALNLSAHRNLFRANVPRLAEGAAEPYVLRQATTDDLPFIMAMYQQAMSRSVLASVRDEAVWRFELEGRAEQSGFSSEYRLIVPSSASETPVGLLIHPRTLWGAKLGVWLFEARAGTPYLVLAPSVLRALDTAGAAYAEREGKPFEALFFNLGESHPLYDTIPTRLSVTGRSYAWYLRVPDLPTFVAHIAPALETRLAASAQAGYSGELKISRYRDGLRLRVHESRIAVAGWMPERVEDGDAAFPDLTFLQLLFGFRSLAELQHAFPDCEVTTDDARALLPTLFPKRDSNVWPGG